MPSGTTIVTFFAQNFGKVTGLVTDSFTQLTPEPGVLNIVADAPAVVGRDEETPEQFRQRRNRSLENPATGSTGAIFAKVAQLTGGDSARAFVEVNNTGPGTFSLVCMTANGVRAPRAVSWIAEGKI